MAAGLGHICEVWDFEITQAVRTLEINSVILRDVSISTASSMCGWIMPPKLSKLLLIHVTARPENKVLELSSSWQYPSVCQASQCQSMMSCSSSILLIDAIVKTNIIMSGLIYSTGSDLPCASRLWLGAPLRCVFKEVNINILLSSDRAADSHNEPWSASQQHLLLSATHTHTHGQQTHRWVNTQRHTHTHKQNSSPV